MFLVECSLFLTVFSFTFFRVLCNSDSRIIFDILNIVRIVIANEFLCRNFAFYPMNTKSNFAWNFSAKALMDWLIKLKDKDVIEDKLHCKFCEMTVRVAAVASSKCAASLSDYISWWFVQQNRWLKHCFVLKVLLFSRLKRKMCKLILHAIHLL